MSRQQDNEQLLTTRDAADLFRLSMAWFERQRWKGEGPTWIRVGGPSGRAVRYRKADLFEWFENNRNAPTMKE